MTYEELSAWLRLALTPGVGNDKARELLAACGLPGAIFEQAESALAQLASPKQVKGLLTPPPELAEQLERTWRWLNETGPEGAPRRLLTLGDPLYPAGLLNMEDPPLMLFTLGVPGLGPDSLARSLAVVGSRNPTPQGAANARHFAKALAQAGLTIVSGLALGVDGAAHEGALEGMPADGALATVTTVATVAVVGTGLDRVYPAKHRELAHRIAQRGLLVSEYLLGTPPLPSNFPKRNRLIAGLAQGTLVVEAALQSGSLITARLTAEQGKEVFAIPGSIHTTQSRGCHALIRQGAKLVESAQDVLEELKLENLVAYDETEAPETGETGGMVGMSGRSVAESGLLHALGFDPVGQDALQARCGLDAASLQAQLLGLELNGHVARLPGGLFQRLASPT
jgi:DNA processing protein